MMFMSPFLLAALVGLVSADPKPAEPAYEFKLDKRGDAIVAEKEKERTVFTVTSESGIGGAVLSLTEGRWPEQITLRFRYAKDKGFNNLEDFRLRTDRVLVEGSLKTSGKMRFCFLGPDGKPETVERGVATPAGSLDVTVKERDGGMDVTLPANVFAGSGKVKVTWIDAFRR